MKNKNNGIDRTIAIIIILLMLLFVGVFSVFVFKNLSYSSNYSYGKDEQCNNSSLWQNVKTIVAMPFFYVLEYPKIIMGISEGNYGYDSAPSQKQGAYKQFLK